MESLQSLKMRLKGVHNINQITKAMELVSATKMRKSQEIALSSRPYVFAALDLLSNITRLTHVPLPPLLQTREGKKTAYVVVTSDKGLAGSFNSAVIRAFDKYSKQNNVSATGSGDGAGDGADDHHFIGVGQKAAAYLEKNFRLYKKFIRFGDYTTIAEVEPLSKLLIKGFREGKWDRVVAVSTHFRSALRQEVLVRQILPATLDSLVRTAKEIVPESGRFAELVKQHDIPLFRKKDLSDPKERVKLTREAAEYIIEPTPEAILENIAEHLVVMEIYHLVLEANASEHAARRMAMKSASDNARDLGDRLAILYNKSRQAVITREILEITAGAESLK
ncbi:MAG: ATP synthase F1 subunit gamma [Candidatus Liptonbacteria bacterium]